MWYYTLLFGVIFNRFHFGFLSGQSHHLPILITYNFFHLFYFLWFYFYYTLISMKIMVKAATIIYILALV